MAPYYIIFTRKNQVMLSFLKVRVVVNNHDIYPLMDSEPVVIPLEKDNPKIVITDGFHFTKPVELKFKEPSYFNFDVVCAIDDMQLIAAGVLLVVLYLLGFFTDLFPIKVASFLPIVWLLLLYYFNRKDFLRVKQSR